MFLRYRLIAIIPLLVSTIFAGDFDGRHYGVNAGFVFSKTLLGGFYSWDRNQINVGTDITYGTLEKGLEVAQPSITYNRYFTESGYYGTAGLMVTYQPDNYSEVREQENLPDTSWSTRKFKRDDWGTPILITGIGKTFQFSHWAIILDAIIVSPLNKNIREETMLWGGAGLSYRFNLK